MVADVFQEALAAGEGGGEGLAVVLVEAQEQGEHVAGVVGRGGLSATGGAAVRGGAGLSGRGLFVGEGLTLGDGLVRGFGLGGAGAVIGGEAVQEAGGEGQFRGRQAAGAVEQGGHQRGLPGGLLRGLGRVAARCVGERCVGGSCAGGSCSVRRRFGRGRSRRGWAGGVEEVAQGDGQFLGEAAQHGQGRGGAAALQHRKGLGGAPDAPGQFLLGQTPAFSEGPDPRADGA